MKRIVSGVKPTGDLHLGNYLGAVSRWAQMSQDPNLELLFFVPNLHALNGRPDPKELTLKTRSAVAWQMAAGVDTSRASIFVQSQVPAHSELTWILNNFVTVGELNRMTQFKDKSRKLGPEGQLVGLYDYPVLMAADILLYDADEVPTGDDQKQHVELTRDIASRFNNLYGATFKVPAVSVASTGARIMDLQDPTKKMSKSDEDLSGCILMADDLEVARKKVMRAVTDSGSQVAAADDKPALTNLLQIYATLSGESVPALEAKYAGRGYGEFKKDLADVVASSLEPLQRKFAELMDPANKKVDEVIEAGRQKAVSLAEPKLAQVKSKLGLL